MLDQLKIQVVKRSLEELGYEDLAKSLIVRSQTGNSCSNYREDGEGDPDPSEEKEQNLKRIVSNIYDDMKAGRYTKAILILEKCISAEDNKKRSEISSSNDSNLDRDGLCKILKGKVAPGSLEMRGLVLLIIFIIKRSYLLEQIVVCALQKGFWKEISLHGDISVHCTQPVTIVDMMSYLRNEALPLLDFVQQLHDSSTFMTAVETMWPQNENSVELFTRNYESSILLPLIMRSPLTLASITMELQKYGLLSSKFSALEVEGIHIFNAIRLNLANSLLSNIFKTKYIQMEPDTSFSIPSNFLDKLIEGFCSDRKRKVPHYLSSRNSEEMEMDLCLLSTGNLEEHYKSRFPQKLLHSLKYHNDEIWVCKFSPLGKYLVTASKDGMLIFYDVRLGFAPLYVLESDESTELRESKAITYCCWDPQERYLITCCFDNMVRIWSVSSLEKMHAKKLEGLSSESEGLSITLKSSFSPGENVRTWACEFLPSHALNQPCFILGSLDKVLKAYDIDGLVLFDFYGDNDDAKLYDNTSVKDISGSAPKDNEVSNNAKKLQRTFNRVNDLSITPDGKFLITVDANKQIHFFTIPSFENPESTTSEVSKITLVGGIVSCSVSYSGKYVLINVKPGELQIWDISNLYHMGTPILAKKLVGHKLGSNIIRSCFGYLSDQGEELVISGSLDGYIYIWNTESAQLVSRIHGHNGICNAVDWNNGYVPEDGDVDYGQVWCSVGDDGILNIWGPPT